MKNFRRLFFFEGDDGAPAGGEPAPTPAPTGGEPTATPSPAPAPTPTSEPTPAPTATPTPTEPVMLVDADGNFKENWWESFESLKDEESMLKNFKTVEGLSKSFANTKRMVGKPFDPTAFPDEQSKAEFYEKLGVPENADGYEFVKPEGFPEGENYNEEQTQWFANICKKYNLTKEQANGIRNEYFSMNNEAYSQAKAEMDKVLDTQRAELIQEWGEEGSPSYKANLEQANKAIEAFSKISGRDVAEDIRSINLDNNPILFRILSQIGANVGEKELAGVGGGSMTMTKEQAQAEINKINAQKDILFNKNHPEHDQLIKRRSELRAIIHPGIYAEI